MILRPQTSPSPRYRQAAGRLQCIRLRFLCCAICHQQRLRLQLTALNTAITIDDVDIPRYNLHKQKGSRSSCWSIKVNKNWRLTFKFKNGDVHILNDEDYH